MKIEAEKNKYHGDTGWESDPYLFTEVAVTWKQWIGRANEHLYTAQILLPHVQQRHLQIKQLMEDKKSGQVQLLPSLNGAYFLHCAFSLENAFKGVLASRFKEEIKNEMYGTLKVPNVLLGHDLIKLARKVEFIVSTDEEYTLAFLSRYGIWAGRYPLPIRNQDYDMTHKLSDGNHYVMGGYNPDTVSAFVNFCDTICSWARDNAEKYAQS